MSAGGPTVSAVVPMYNEAAFVREALRSLLAQTYDPIEIIAVDDGSTDGTAAIAREFATRFDAVEVLRNGSNVGQSVARNRGAKAATGEYLVFHDADDVSTPDRIEKQVAYMERNPDVGVLGSGYFYLNDVRDERSVRLRPTDDESLRRSLSRQSTINLGTAMYRASALDDVGLFETESLEGFDLLIRLAAEYDLANLPEPLYVYRVTENSRSRTAERRKKLILIRRCLQAARSLNVGYRNLLLAPGWIGYMYLPTRVKAAVRRVFSPTEDEPIADGYAAKLGRTLAIVRRETVTFSGGAADRPEDAEAPAVEEPGSVEPMADVRMAATAEGRSQPARSPE